MNIEERAAFKAARRAKKRGKKEQGASIKAPMIVHRPPIERKEVSRKLYDRMIKKSRVSSVGAAFSFCIIALYFLSEFESSNLLT